MSIGRRQIQVLHIAESFFQAHVLFALNSLDVFELLASGPRSGREVAAALGGEEHSIDPLLRAGVAVGLLERMEEGYTNSNVANAVLVTGSEGYVGNWIRLMERHMHAWFGLQQSAVSGVPSEDPFLHLGGDPEYTKDFTKAMGDYARVRGAEVAAKLDLSTASKLLDLGGGPGTYAILFAQTFPRLRTVVFDLPEVVKIAREEVEAAGLTDRVSVVAGDYLTDEFGSDFDVVFISGALPQETPENCEKILRKSFNALKSGGRCVVQGMFLNEDRCSPRWAVMYALTLMLTTKEGRAFTVGETIALLENAGFRNCTHKRMQLLNVNSLIVGHKP